MSAPTCPGVSSYVLRMDRWENVSAQSVEWYDRLLRDVIEAMPRPSRERYRTRILALVDRLLNDPRQRQKWHVDQWDEECLTWW